MRKRRPYIMHIQRNFLVPLYNLDLLLYKIYDHQQVSRERYGAVIRTERRQRCIVMLASFILAAS